MHTTLHLRAARSAACPPIPAQAWKRLAVGIAGFLAALLLAAIAVTLPG